jgi:hypothetical protein
MKASACLTFLTEKAAEEEKGLDQIRPHEIIREDPPESLLIPQRNRLLAWNGLAIIYKTHR